MEHKNQELGRILDLIADELNITPTMMDKAVSSYEAVGKWLGEGIDYKVTIKPQGSMNLGTVVRPIDEDDDYDMDLVCLLEGGQNLLPKSLKGIVGNRLKEHEIYKQKLEKEGKRCWTMSYDGFHMDILPSSPQYTKAQPFGSTSIRLTHKLENGEYINKYSDPEAYHDWFVDRMTNDHPINKSGVFSERATKIEKVPTYKRRTTLQKAIQLLKRHRDIMFLGNSDDAPISIIITTLAAYSYKGESNIYDALMSILDNMQNHIEYNNGEYKILNPVMQEENFADKWNEKPQKADNFFRWLTTVKKDILESPLKLSGIDEIGEALKQCLGEKPINRALNKYGEEMRTARENNRLYVDVGKNGLVNTAAASSLLKVKGHTFFGI